MCALVYSANSPAVFAGLSCQIKSKPICRCIELTSSLVCLKLQGEAAQGHTWSSYRKDWSYQETHSGLRQISWRNGNNYVVSASCWLVAVQRCIHGFKQSTLAGKWCRSWQEWAQFPILLLGIHALFQVKKCITDHICTLFVEISHHQYSVATWHIALIGHFTPC